jgi:hypothetical protein
MLVLEIAGGIVLAVFILAMPGIVIPLLILGYCLHEFPMITVGLLGALCLWEIARQTIRRLSHPALPTKGKILAKRLYQKCFVGIA